MEFTDFERVLLGVERRLENDFCRVKFQHTIGNGVECVGQFFSTYTIALPVDIAKLELDPKAYTDYLLDTFIDEIKKSIVDTKHQ